MSDMAVTGTSKAAYVPRRLSVVIRALADNATDPLTVGDIRDALGDRSFAALLAFFAVINLLPLPPGTTLILGLPLVIISVQMILGHHRAWLPQFVLRKSVSAARFRALADRHLPRLVRLEKWIQPRYWPFATKGVDDRTIGILSLVLGLTVTVPIPFSNWLPAFAILLLALALSERDGILFGIGTVIGGISILIVAAVLTAAGAVAGILFT
jgi:hypothetical protein